MVFLIFFIAFTGDQKIQEFQKKEECEEEVVLLKPLLLSSLST